MLPQPTSTTSSPTRICWLYDEGEKEEDWGKRCFFEASQSHRKNVWLILGHCSLIIPPENVKNQWFSVVFRGYIKETLP